MERLPWFPCYPSKLLGALAGMKPDEGYIYWIVCLRIYEVNGPCLDTLDAIARRSGMNKRRVSDALDLSFRSGRLLREGAGIMNPFAAGVLADSVALHEKRVRAGGEGGKRTAEKRQWKHGRVGSTAAAKPQPNGTHLQEQLQLKKEDKTAPSPKPSKRAKPRTQIPERSVLVDGENMDFAIAKGFDPVQAREMFVEFRDYHIGKGNLQADWSATWRTWVRNQIKFKGRPNGGSNGKTTTALGGFSGLGARLRQSVADEGFELGESAAGGESAHRR